MDTRSKSGRAGHHREGAHRCRGRRGAVRGGADSRRRRPARRIRRRSARHRPAAGIDRDERCRQAASTRWRPTGLRQAGRHAGRRTAGSRVPRTSSISMIAQVPRGCRCRLAKGEALLSSWKATGRVDVDIRAEADGRAARLCPKSFDKKDRVLQGSGTLTAPFRHSRGGSGRIARAIPT